MTARLATASPGRAARRHAAVHPAARNRRVLAV